MERKSRLKSTCVSYPNGSLSEKVKEKHQRGNKLNLHRANVDSRLSPVHNWMCSCVHTNLYCWANLIGFFTLATWEYTRCTIKPTVWKHNDIHTIRSTQRTCITMLLEEDRATIQATCIKNSPDRGLRSSPDLDPDLGWPWKSYRHKCLIDLYTKFHWDGTKMIFGKFEVTWFDN